MKQMTESFETLKGENMELRHVKCNEVDAAIRELNYGVTSFFFGYRLFSSQLTDSYVVRNCEEMNRALDIMHVAGVQELEIDSLFSCEDSFDMSYAEVERGNDARRELIDFARTAVREYNARHRNLSKEGA